MYGCAPNGALLVRLRSLSSFSKKNSRKFSGVLGALPIGEGVDRNEVRAQGETSPSWRKLCVKDTKKNYES